jgi:hypothetical protein
LEHEASFGLFMVKFVSAIALHCTHFPEYRNGLQLMKFANNHVDLFVDHGAKFSFMVGSFQALTGFMAEFLSIFILKTQVSVTYAIIFFVALKVIGEIGKIYFEGIIATNLIAHAAHGHIIEVDV